MNKLIPITSLGDIRVKHKNKKIVHCHGVFDLFHPGHLSHLISAKAYGDILVVTITPDHYVNKGPHRPRFSDSSRAKMLGALSLVDYVSVNNTPSAVEPILALQPDFYVKGPDYSNKEVDITGGIQQEELAVVSCGGALVFTNDGIESSTELINNYFHQWNFQQKSVIEQVKSNYEESYIVDLIDTFKGLKVLVVGEPIVDTYVFCKPDSISSKSPSISASFLREENYAGGSLAVARHLNALGCDVRLLAPIGNEPYLMDAMNSITQDGSIKTLMTFNSQIATPRKTRYITSFLNQRIFELVELRTKDWMESSLNKFDDIFLAASRDVDIVIVLDFGHGLWEKSRLNLLGKVDKFKAINIQTNSSNYGYNLFYKHQNYDYLVLDERELRLGMHDRFNPIREVVENASSNRIESIYSVTLGVNGSLFIDKDRQITAVPTYFTEPIDTTGAGDAYFALTSLLAYKNVSPVLLGFLGNIFAGLKTKIVGNKDPVKRVDLIRAVRSILG